MLLPTIQKTHTSSVHPLVIIYILGLRFAFYKWNELLIRRIPWKTFERAILMEKILSQTIKSERTRFSCLILFQHLISAVKTLYILQNPCDVESILFVDCLPARIFGREVSRRFICNKIPLMIIVKTKKSCTDCWSIIVIIHLFHVKIQFIRVVIL